MDVQYECDNAFPSPIAFLKLIS